MIDSHAHYDDERFDKDRDEAIMLAKNSGVEIIINAASDIETSKKAIALSEKYDFIYALCGIHPHETEKAEENSVEIIEKLVTENKKAVAIGEIGLDYHYDFSPRDIQKKWFAMQMELAEKLGVPVVIHSREATEDTLVILRKFPNVKGIIHSFSGSTETLAEVLKMGYSISLGGVVTFKNAKYPVEVAKVCPIDKLLLETDCPYLAPTPHRGERNGSHLMIHTAEKIAELRNMDTDELCRVCAENTKRIFNI